jgi:ribosomal protein S18 acetylase RimI-like enzyme
MSLETMMREVMEASPYLPPAELPVTAEELGEEHRAEVLSFLLERPLHTVCMAGLIRDNGLVSPHNRGAFYGCRNSEGRLEGVALIGHHTLVEARTRRASKEFALLAQCCTNTHLIMGELDKVEEFWNHYADEGRPMRLACRELLFELRRPVETAGEADGLRLATPEDLDLIVPVQAHLVELESRINPLDTDPEGFRARCLRRVEMGRTWVIVKGGRLLFKAEVQADTPEVIYLEGVYVDPSVRGTGAGRKYMAELCRLMFARTRTVCLLVNEENERAHRFYRFCGFRLRSVYDTIFLGGH